MWNNVVYVTHFFNVNGIKKSIHLMIILENDEWFLLLQVELEIESLL